MNKIKYLLVFVGVVLASASSFSKISSFAQGKAALKKSIYNKKIDQKTFYCGCKYQKRTITLKGCGYRLKKYKKRSRRLEWEHIVPAHAFGKSFKEWRNASKLCPAKRNKKGKLKKVGGRKCALRLSKKFREMEGNVYNLVPAIGAVNALRSNLSFAEIKKTDLPICSAGFKKSGRKVMPPENRKGDIARIYMYMDWKYPGHGIISRKNKKLFAAWDKLDPVNVKECAINKKKAIVQGEENFFVVRGCTLLTTPPS